MKPVPVLIALTVVFGCGGSSGVAPSVVPVDSESTQPGGQLDPGRDYAAEYEAFKQAIGDSHGTPAQIAELLQVAPDEYVQYTTIDGEELASAEYRLKGPQPGAPFFEAFAAEHPGRSFFVFFEKSWFQWRAVDCGFHESGLFGAQVAQQ